MFQFTRQMVTVPLAAIAIVTVIRQCRKPFGWPGRFILWQMNLSHSKLTDWGLGHITVGRDQTILDVGCGGGRTLQKLASVATGGKLFGLDYSAASVAAARHKNADAIARGRVEIQQGSVAQLPYPDNQFDLVTGVETHYYWPDLPANMREILRVLKPGGTVLLIAEAYKSSRFGKLHELAMKPLGGTVLSVEEHRDLLSKAGYSSVEVHENYKKGWICAIGRKAASAG